MPPRPPATDTRRILPYRRSSSRADTSTVGPSMSCPPLPRPVGRGLSAHGGAPEWGVPGGCMHLVSGTLARAFAVSLPGHTSLGGRGVPPRGWSEGPVGPAGRLLYPRSGTPAWGTENPSHRVARVSYRARGGSAVFKNRASRPGGMGSPALGVVRVSCRALGEAPVLKTRAQQPGGTGSPPRGTAGVSCRACGEFAFS